MGPTHFDRLIADWRQRAQTLRRYGDSNFARVWEEAADELAAAVAEQGEAALTLNEASARTGYTTDHLASLIRRGVIANAGRKGAPRIRHTDLPPPKRRGGPGRPSRSRRSTRELTPQHLSLTPP